MNPPDWAYKVEDFYVSPEDLSAFLPSYLSNFTCSICFKIFRDPLLTRCNHVFCKECFYSWLSKKATCPICRRSIGRHSLRGNVPLIKASISKFRRRCPNAVHGCKEVVTIETLKNHLQKCEWVLTQCTNSLSRLLCSEMKMKDVGNYEEKCFHVRKVEQIEMELMKTTDWVYEVEDFYVSTEDLSAFLPDYLSSFTCSICFKVFCDPVLTRCNHVFCRKCISSWFLHEVSCPICHVTVKICILRENIPLIKASISKFRRCCPNAIHGCKKVMTIETLENHLQKCECFVIQCTSNFCTEIIKKEDVENHERNCFHVRRVKEIELELMKLTENSVIQVFGPGCIPKSNVTSKSIIPARKSMFRRSSAQRRALASWYAH